MLLNLFLCALIKRDNGISISSFEYFLFISSNILSNSSSVLDRDKFSSDNTKHTIVIIIDTLSPDQLVVSNERNVINARQHK